MSESVQLLAYDPGGTTGWAKVSLSANCLLHGSILTGMEFEVGQIPGIDAAQGRQIRLQLALWSGPVVIEDFVLRKFSKDRDLLAPVRITARIEQTVETLREHAPEKPRLPVFKQQPSLAMSVCTDARMRSWGIWTPGAPHANDALRHAVTFLRRCRSDASLLYKAFEL